MPATKRSIARKKQASQRRRPVPTATTHADPVAAAMAALLPVHSALTIDWLVDAACTAAERALNAPFTMLFFEDHEGKLEYRAPASDLRRRSMHRALDPLGENVFRRKIEATDLPSLAQALDSNAPVITPVSEFFAPLVGGAKALAAQKAMGVGVSCVAPLETAGERLGALLMILPQIPDTVQARLLAEHIACALVNLRQTQTAREQGTIDIVRSVFDARKLETELQRELARGQRYKREVSIAVIEATNLSLLRDRFGRFLTDQLLQRTGEALAQHSRDIDLLGAYKQSGYTMILTEASSNGASKAAQRLLLVAQTARLEGEDVPGLELHLALGYASSPKDGTTTDALFAAAEHRMYGTPSNNEQVA